MQFLEEKKMCKINSNTKFSIVTIVKWQEYQIEDTNINNIPTTNFFEGFNNKTECETIDNTEVYGIEDVFFNNKHTNNKTNNKINCQTIDNKEVEENLKIKTNNKTNNKSTTSQHKQEYKEYYINLFNKYIKENRKRFKNENEIFTRAKGEGKYIRRRRRKNKKFNFRG